jgi:hypothetical protein
MDEVRILTRMARKAPNCTAANSSVADSKRTSTLIPAVARIASSASRTAKNTTSYAFGCSNPKLFGASFPSYDKDQKKQMLERQIQMPEAQLEIV